MPEATNGRLSFREMSVDTRTIVNKFKELKVGEEISYTALSELIGRNIRGKAYGNLQSARRSVLKNGIVIGTVQKVGVRRLDDVAIVRTGASEILRIHKIGLRTARKMACVQDFDAMPAETKIRHNAALSMLAVVLNISSGSTQKKIEAKVKSTGASLPLQKTLNELG